MDSGRATVRNMRSKCRCSCVLQFTFRRAVSCVLHRPPSQVIHCIVLYLKACLPGESASPKKHHSDHTSHRWEHKVFNSGEGREIFERSPSNWLLLEHRTPVPSRPPEVEAPLQQPDPTTVRKPRAGRLEARGGPPSEEEPRPNPKSDFLVREQSSEPSIMILPQVHLRKPCYDFYFL